MRALGAALHGFPRSLLLRRPSLRTQPAIGVTPSRPAIPTVARVTTYVICTSPRSGSWLLSDGLSSTDVAGKPREWFNLSEEQNQRALWRMRHDWDLSRGDYLRLAMSKSTTRNGVSGTKIHYYQLVDLVRTLGGSSFTAGQLMTRLFPGAKYIWLKRRDKARQAVSWVIASQTNRWWDVSRNEPEPYTVAPEFDPQAIARMEQRLRWTDTKWQSIFEENGITPLVIVYEDLAEDYIGTIRSVLSWLDIPNADDSAVPETRLHRQSNAQNEEWLARYRKWATGPNALAEDMYTEEATSGGTPRELNVIPAAWKQWIYESKSKNMSDEKIVRVLVRNGYSRDAALAATTAPVSIG